MSVSGEIATFVSSELAARADPAKAATMAAYLKTDRPFYGVQRPGPEEIERAVKSYTEPERVACFVEKHRDRLSGRSIREALKALPRKV